MSEAVPEPVFPEADPYPSYRASMPIDVMPVTRSPIDQYVLSAVIATGTVLVQRTPVVRRVTEV